MQEGLLCCADADVFLTSLVICQCAADDVSISQSRLVACKAVLVLFCHRCLVYNSRASSFLLQVANMALPTGLAVART